MAATDRYRASNLSSDLDLFQRRPNADPKSLSRATSKIERSNAPSIIGAGSKSLRYYPAEKDPRETIDAIKKSAEDLADKVRISEPGTLKFATPKVEKPNPLEVAKMFSKKALSSPSGEELKDPLPPLESALDENDLRESAYELVVGVSGARSDLKNPSTGNAAKSDAVSIFAKAFSRKPLETTEVEVEYKPSPMEVLLRQMKFPESFDERIRRGLSQAAGSQAGKKHENLIAPLELLMYLGPADFASQRDYLRWRRRQLALLEEGLIYSPATKSDGRDTSTLTLRSVLDQVRNGQIDLNDGHQKLSFRVAVVGKAESPETGRGAIRWANGYPFNVHIYMSLLKAGFSLESPNELALEIADLIELVQKAWPVLGVTRVLHHTVFAWVLFQQFYNAGHNDDILVAASFAQVEEAFRIFRSSEEDEEGITEQQREMEKQGFRDFFGTMQAFAEKRLFSYHETFPMGARGVMEHLVGIALYTEEILQSEEVLGYQSRNRKKRLNPAQDKAELYIRSSIKGAFAMVHEMVTSQRRSSRGREGLAPVLVSLAVEAGELAEKEVSLYSPAFKQWCAYSGGVAAATVHNLYSTELKQFVFETKFLTQEAAQVLLAADRLEKQLVQTAVEASEDCEDGGAVAIRQMPPFETESAMQRLLSDWVDDRLAKFNEWVERTVTKEEWDPSLLPQHHAPSAVDVSQLLKETIQAFFELPLPPSGDILVKLTQGMEAALEIYAEKVVGSIGSKDAFLPPLPALTRYKKDLFLKAQQAYNAGQLRGRPGPGGGGGALPGAATAPRPPVTQSVDSSLNEMDVVSLPRLCCRINTLYFIMNDLDELERLIRRSWEACLAPPSPGNGTQKGVRVPGIRAFFATPKKGEQVVSIAPPLPGEMLDLFVTLKASMNKSVGVVCEYAAYKVVFKDMKPFVTDGLYMGGVSNKNRMADVIEGLRPYLIAIVDNIAAAARDRLVGSLLRALSVAVLRVLLAGGPGRAYNLTDVRYLEKDLRELKELFLDGGEGLPAEEVERSTYLYGQILHLFGWETEDLIRSFDAAYAEWIETQKETKGKDGRMLIPGTRGKWSINDPNTILRVLSYRADRKGSKMLKNLFDFPKA